MCRLEGDFLTRFAAQAAQLRSLILDYCHLNGSGLGKMVLDVGQGFHNLQNLCIGGGLAELHLVSLSELKSLQCLSIHSCTPVGMENFLSSAQQLRELRLEGIAFWPEGGMRLVSKSLQTLCIDEINLALTQHCLCMMTPCDLPSLRVIEFGALDLTDFDAGAGEMLQSLITSLSQFQGLRAVDTMGDSTFYFETDSEWSDQEVLSALHTLSNSPIAYAFRQDLGSLELQFRPRAGYIQALSQLFCGVDCKIHTLRCWCGFADHEGVADAVVGFPSLELLRISFHSDDDFVPNSMLSALFAAQSSPNRLFELDVSANDELFDRLATVQAQWDGVCARYFPQSRVAMNVK